MTTPHVDPTHIVHDDRADLLHCERRLLHDLHWVGRMIAGDPPRPDEQTARPSGAAPQEQV